MRRLLHSAFLRMLCRPCRGCICTDPHSHHLTRLGRWHYAKVAV